MKKLLLTMTLFAATQVMADTYEIVQSTQGQVGILSSQNFVLSGLIDISEYTERSSFVSGAVIELNLKQSDYYKAANVTFNTSPIGYLNYQPHEGQYDILVQASPDELSEDVLKNTIIGKSTKSASTAKIQLAGSCKKADNGDLLCKLGHVASGLDQKKGSQAVDELTRFYGLDSKSKSGFADFVEVKLVRYIGN